MVAVVQPSLMVAANRELEQPSAYEFNLEGARCRREYSIMTSANVRKVAAFIADGGGQEARPRAPRVT
jgi:hypothetical protein